MDDSFEKLEIVCLLCGVESDVYRDKDTDPAFCKSCQFPLRTNTSVPLEDKNLTRYIDLCQSKMTIAFWAPYDSNCSTFMPLYNSRAAIQSESNILVSVDISKNPVMKRHFGIQHLPTIVVIEYGREINRILGTVTPHELDRLIEGGSI